MRDVATEVARQLTEALQCTAERGLVTVSAVRQDREVVVMIRETGRGSTSEEVPCVLEQSERIAAMLAETRKH
ncbi:MAG: hypothetical protein ACRERD_33250 [Candidatus Binatia bacterium]